MIIPPEPIVTWEEAEQHLKLDGDDTDRTLVEAYIAAATAHIDGPGGWLDRCLGMQTLEARIDNFGCGSVRLPYPEVREIVSVKYVDSGGVETTIAPAGYEIIGGALQPAWGASWPTPRWQREAVRVRYRAGYEAGAPQLAVASVAVLLMVGDLYRNRETTRDGVNVTAVPMSTTVDNLLAPLRPYR